MSAATPEQLVLAAVSFSYTLCNALLEIGIFCIILLKHRRFDACAWYKGQFEARTVGWGGSVSRRELEWGPSEIWMATVKGTTERGIQCFNA
jgi:hypothetical protein